MIETIIGLILNGLNGCTINELSTALNNRGLNTITNQTLYFDSTSVKADIYTDQSQEDSTLNKWLVVIDSIYNQKDDSLVNLHDGLYLVFNPQSDSSTQADSLFPLIVKLSGIENRINNEKNKENKTYLTKSISPDGNFGIYSSKEFDIGIYDITGRLQSIQQLKEGNNTIQVKGPAGQYFIRPLKQEDITKYEWKGGKLIKLN